MNVTLCNQLPEDTSSAAPSGNFQKGTLVHLSKEGLHSAVGEVVLWDEGKLVVDVLGEKADRGSWQSPVVYRDQRDRPKNHPEVERIYPLVI